GSPRRAPQTRAARSTRTAPDRRLQPAHRSTAMSAGPRQAARAAALLTVFPNVVPTTRCIALAVALAATACAMPLLAQEDIALDAAAINRLGLVFATLAEPDAADGARFPARV